MINNGFKRRDCVINNIEGQVATWALVGVYVLCVLCVCMERGGGPAAATAADKLWVLG
jgi:hypothetical protein